MNYETIGKQIGELVDKKNKQKKIPKEIRAIARKNGIRYATLRARIANGMELFEAATKPTMTPAESAKLAAKHGLSDTPMYHKWENMKQRCFNPKRPGYENYGGRGITVCDEWLDFEYFKRWCLKNGYSDDLEIDRIDNDGNYEPSNCRFVTAKKNSYNKRNTRKYEYRGKLYKIPELSKVANIHPTTLRTRLFNGMSIKEAVETPVSKTGRYNPDFYKRRVNR